MNGEQNLPEAPASQGLPPAQQGDSYSSSSNAPGMGQSKSSRRRRRKRKGKGDDFGPEPQAQPAPQPGFAPSLQAQSAPAGPSPAPPMRDRDMQSQGGGGQQFGSGPQQFSGGSQQFGNAQGKRWKKKFRDRDRGDRGDRGPRFSDNPGNQGFSGSNGGNASPAPALPRDTNTHQFGNRADGFKRKAVKTQRDRGPRGFVGPMDHSYRALTGGFETSPSTIDTSVGMGWSRSYDSSPVDYSQGRAVPVAPDSPPRIYLFVEDLFIIAKINETTRKLGVKVNFVKNDKESVAEVLALEDDSIPALIVFDLNNANAKPLTLIPKLKTKFKRHSSIIGFLSQIQGDLKAKAVEAGCDTVMARSAFSQNLPNLLRRYGLDEEFDEGNFNR